MKFISRYPICLLHYGLNVRFALRALLNRYSTAENENRDTLRPMPIRKVSRPRETDHGRSLHDRTYEYKVATSNRIGPLNLCLQGEETLGNFLGMKRYQRLIVSGEYRIGNNNRSGAFPIPKGRRAGKSFS